MMPLGDDNSDRRTIPIVTYSLIIINILVFLLEIQGGEAFILNWAFTPSQFLAHPIANIPTLFTSMFMHGGWGHLIGNMLYLWIFGDNVEDNFGKVKYLIFYIVCGLAATFLQFFFNSGSSIPNLGASGAIAGVLGAYMLQRPHGKINVMIGFGVTQMPALIVIGFWFVLQFFSGIGSLASTEDVGGVAYMAHIGGFLAGLGIAFIFNNTPKSNSTSSNG
ncbi:MAG: rhomboid family intramembrane serine protease [Parachlamydiaceae bacterium]|nr:rhomboid family intramembrane serine protease [Parachlamydiaceae bacterium]